MTTTTWLITGANRGVGRGLADTILSRPNHHLIALVRDPSNETSQSLLSQPKAPSSTVTVVAYDASNTQSASQALSTLQTSHNVTSIDVVVANAGSMGPTDPATELSPSDLMDLYTSNTIAPMMLFNATLPLLRNSSHPAFIAISSAVGSTGRLSQVRSHRALPYGMSKAALNHAVCKLNIAHPEVAFGLLTPGPTKTGFGGKDFNWEMVKGVQSLDVVVPGLMQRIDEVVAKGPMEDVVFCDWKGEVVPW